MNQLDQFSKQPWESSEEFFVLVMPCKPNGMIYSRSCLPLLGLHCLMTMFAQVKPGNAQSELDRDNAQIQEQLLSTQHPMLEGMPDRWEPSILDLPWINNRRLPWNKSLRSMAIDSLGLGIAQCQAMDSLVRAHGRPAYATFWMMLPWMEAATAVAFQQTLDREFPMTEIRPRSIRPGMDILYGTHIRTERHAISRPSYLERWQYRIRQQFGNIGCAITLEKSMDQGIGGLPGFFVQGKAGPIQWILGDFHPQSGNQLFHQTLRTAAFSNPWAHRPGTEIPLTSCRMNSGNQVRGLGIHTSWGPYLLVMNSYALRSLYMPHQNFSPDSGAISLAENLPKILWIHSLALQIQRPWGVLGWQYAIPSWLTIPASWDSTLLAARRIEFSKLNETPMKLTKELGSLGFNMHIQRHNYYFQSNWLAHPSTAAEAWIKDPKPSNPTHSQFLQAWALSQLHTLVLTPHSHWSIGLRLSKISQRSEAAGWVNSDWPTNAKRQSFDINAQWSPVPSWSITARSHWIEEKQDQHHGFRNISWVRGLDGKLLKGPFRDGRYTMIYKEGERGRQGYYLFQYLRLPWPSTGPRGEKQGLGGYLQIAHGYSKPSQQTWALAYQMLWKRIFRTGADLKIGQTWVIAGSEGEQVTVREDYSFGAGWWTGSSRQYRFTASLQGRGGGYGWRLWLRRIEDELALRWETGLTFTQRWDEN